MSIGTFLTRFWLIFEPFTHEDLSQYSAFLYIHVEDEKEKLSGVKKILS